MFANWLAVALIMRLALFWRQVLMQKRFNSLFIIIGRANKWAKLCCIDYARGGFRVIMATGQRFL